MTTTKDKSALLLVAFIGVFILGSMVLVIVLAFQGAGDSNGENVWAGLFSLVTAILGAVGGYLGGSTIEARKHQAPVDPGAVVIVADQPLPDEDPDHLRRDLGFDDR